jgi:hypothetical protein
MQSEMYKCILCDAEFAQKRGLEYHIEHKTCSKRIFKCDFCTNRAYKTEYSLKRHKCFGKLHEILVNLRKDSLNNLNLDDMDPSNYIEGPTKEELEEATKKTGYDEQFIIANLPTTLKRLFEMYVNNLSEWPVPASTKAPSAISAISSSPTATISAAALSTVISATVTSATALSTVIAPAHTLTIIFENSPVTLKDLFDVFVKAGF